MQHSYPTRFFKPCRNLKPNTPFKPNSPSPDCSGNPFILLTEALEGNKIKDWNGKLEIAP